MKYYFENKGYFIWMVVECGYIFMFWRFFYFRFNVVFFVVLYFLVRKEFML